MRSGHPVRRLVVTVALLVALTASSCAGSLNITRYVNITRPPESGTPVRLSDTTYEAILGKGYARIGSLYASQDDTSEESVAEAVLEEARRLGAAAVRLSISSSTMKGWSGASPAKVMTTVDSKGNTDQVFLPGSSGHASEVKTVRANAELFARDPALAAKQLREAPERWTKKVEASRARRSTLLAKLSTLQDKLRQLHAPQINNDSITIQNVRAANKALAERRARDRARGAKSLPGLANEDPSLVEFPELARYLQAAMDEIASGEHWIWEEDCFVPTNGYYLKKMEDLLSSAGADWRFKDPKSPQVKEFMALADDARAYLKSSMDFIADGSLENYPEHFYFPE